MFKFRQAVEGKEGCGDSSFWCPALCHENEVASSPLVLALLPYHSLAKLVARMEERVGRMQ